MGTDRSGDDGPATDTDLARLVRSRRRELGLTRNDLVEASGLSYPYVAQIETGRRTPSRKSTARLAGALRLPPEALDVAIPFDAGTPRAATAPRSRAGWHANPTFAAAAPRADASGSDADAIERVLNAISSLTPTERLRVLNDAQRRVLDELG